MEGNELTLIFFDVSEFLTTIIEACLDGQLDEKLVTERKSQSENNRIDKLEEQVNQIRNKLDIYIDKIGEGEKERSLFSQQLSKLSQKIEIEDHQLSDDQVIDSDNLEQQPEEELTNAELSRRIGVTSSTVSRWANKKRQPPKDLEWRYDSQLKKWVKN